MTPPRSTRLQGKTLRWTFDDGPVAGKAFEHRFDADGSVAWRGAGDAAAPWHVEREAATADLGNAVSVVSYRAASGHTLTVVLDFAHSTMIGFGSNSDMWSQQRGRFELAG